MSTAKVKTATGWEYISRGQQGDQGLSLLSGEGAPESSFGRDGDFYLDTDAHWIYGPKTAGAWGSGTALVGPAGDVGPAGPQGLGILVIDHAAAVPLDTPPGTVIYRRPA